MKVRRFLWCLLFSVPVLYGLYYVGKKAHEPKYWLGLFKSLNFRDVGESLTQCSNETYHFASHLIFRSNKYFSGWSCHNIQDPDVIYTLNNDPAHPKKYYCTEPDETKHYGINFSEDFKINEEHLEQIGNWLSPTPSLIFCQYINAMIDDLLSMKSFLVHCEAGRDRTGMMIGVLAASLMEQKKIPVGVIDNLLECDYRKTPSLEKEKYGRLETLLKGMREESRSVSQFLIQTCHIDPNNLKKAAFHFVK